MLGHRRGSDPHEPPAPQPHDRRPDRNNNQPAQPTTTRDPDPELQHPVSAAIPAIGTTAASSNVRLAGFNATESCETQTYSANEPNSKNGLPGTSPSTWPNTSSPDRNRVTLSPTASICPAKSAPRPLALGLSSPLTRRMVRGFARMVCQSLRLTDAAAGGACGRVGSECGSAPRLDGRHLGPWGGGESVVRPASTNAAAVPSAA